MSSYRTRKRDAKKALKKVKTNVRDLTKELDVIGSSSTQYFELK
jgi:hypothetical protein